MIVGARERADRTFLESGETAAWVARALAGLSGLAGEKQLAGKLRRGRG